MAKDCSKFQGTQEIEYSSSQVIFSPEGIRSYFLAPSKIITQFDSSRTTEI